MIFALLPLLLSINSINAQAPLIITGTIITNPFCACDSLHVPFTSAGTYIAGNIFIAQLSDAAGSFAVPFNIDSLVSTSILDSISCAIPCGTLTGGTYRIRVISTTPADTGSDNGVDIIINAAVVPSVSITAALLTGTLCSDSATFTATPTNGGLLPIYQWQLNGVTVGTDSNQYHTSAALANGDIVSITLTSNAACAVPAAVQADTTVNCVAITTGTITGSPFCSCDSVKVPFTSIGTFGAANIFSAQLSDSSGSFAAPVIIGSLPSVLNTDTVVCVIPCSALSGTGYLIRVISSSPIDTGSNNGVNIIINTTVVPSVSMDAVAAVALCIDTSVAFTASSVNGGAAPTYQWRRNGVAVGTNSAVYNSSGTFMNAEVISVTMTSNAVCASPAITQTNIVIACEAMSIPNVFTPNGDGINDVFKINLSGENLTSFDLNIFDRWGILIFSSQSLNNKWDGRTTSGIKVVSGTYFYILEINSKQYKGHISVFAER